MLIKKYRELRERIIGKGRKRLFKCILEYIKGIKKIKIRETQNIIIDLLRYLNLRERKIFIKNNDANNKK